MSKWRVHLEESSDNDKLFGVQVIHEGSVSELGFAQPREKED